jgi:putative transposase
VWTLARFIYVALIVDVFSHRILGWRVTTTKHTAMVTDALRQALQLRRRGQHEWIAAGLIHHSDAGSQYVSVAFTAELLDAGIAGSIGSVSDALDNALCESTIGPFKTEAINLAGPAWRDRRDVEWQVAPWIHWSRYAGDVGVSVGEFVEVGGRSVREVRGVRSAPSAVSAGRWRRFIAVGSSTR